MLFVLALLANLHAFTWNKTYKMSFILAEHAVPIKTSNPSEYNWSELSQFIKVQKYHSYQNGERLFFFHLGGINDGGIVSDLLSYRPDFLSLKSMDVDAMALSRREFNFFEKELKEEQRLAGEKFVSSNLIRKRNKWEKWIFPEESLFRFFHKIQYQDLNLGFFNFLDEDLRQDKVFRETHLEWLEPLKAYAQLKKQLGDRFDLEMIRIGETSLDPKKIDWKNTLVTGPKSLQSKLPHLIPSPQNAAELVRVDVQIKNGVIFEKKVRVINASEVKRAGSDREVQRMLSQYLKRSEIILSDQLGVIEKDYTFNYAQGNLDKHFWGYLILKSYLKYFNADIAFMDYGNIKKFPEKGPLFYRDVLGTYADQQELCEVELLGRELQDYLSYMTYKFPFEKGGKPIGIGFKFAQGDGEENYLLVGDKFLRQQSKYKMVVPRRLLLGGESYPNLSVKNKFECSSLKEHHVFSHYIKGVKTL